MLFVYDNYYAFLSAAAFGSGFFPIGVRNGWTAGNKGVNKGFHNNDYFKIWLTWNLHCYLSGLDRVFVDI